MIGQKIIKKVGGCLLASKVMIYLLILPLLLSYPKVQAAEDCGDTFYIDESLPNGARWDMCWEPRAREGIIFHKVYYTPKNGQRKMVLNHAAVAQIHIPYDDNGSRFHDLTDIGIGDMKHLESDECLDGQLLKSNGKNILCKQIIKKDLSFKTKSRIAMGHSLELFSISTVRDYSIVPKWRFFENGAIEPWMGVTSQFMSTDQDKIWKLANNRISASHLHNFFWKLDFDLNKTKFNDVVEEVNIVKINDKQEQSIVPLDNETARKVNPATRRFWQIRDKNDQNKKGFNFSYAVLFKKMQHQDMGPASEPFTHNDFFVTKYKHDEKFVSHNTSGRNNLAEFVNEESLIDSDLVIWAGVTYFHTPNTTTVDTHWSHIQLAPQVHMTHKAFRNDMVDKKVKVSTKEKLNGAGTFPIRFLLVLLFIFLLRIQYRNI